MTAAHDQGPHPLGTSQLVGGHRDEVEPERIAVHGYVGGLRGVGMQPNPGLPAHRPDLGQRLHHADLVVDPHHGHERGVRTQRGSDRVGVHHAVTVDGEHGDLDPLPTRERGDRIEHRLVLGGHGDHVPRPRGGPHQPQDREVVGLGGSAGEDHLLGRGPEPRRDLPPRPLHHPARPLTQEMRPRCGIAELLRKPGVHRGQHLGVTRRGGVMIEVDRPLVRH